jgi:hypothetical protein
MVLTSQIGDGKTPNKYWVTTTNDFYIDKKNHLDWASEKLKFKVSGKTSKPHKTYQEALAEASHIIETEIGDNPETQGVNAVFIEDRISGQLFEHTLTAKRLKGLLKGWKIGRFESEDLEFTKKKLGKVV